MKIVQYSLHRFCTKRFKNAIFPHLKNSPDNVFLLYLSFSNHITRLISCLFKWIKHAVHSWWINHTAKSHSDFHDHKWTQNHNGCNKELSKNKVYFLSHDKPTLGWGSPAIKQYLTIKICDKILRNIARRVDVSRTSLSSENNIMKSSKYNEEMNK